MRITVCIKQVPDTADIKWNDDNTLNRESAESIINPFDMYAAETALRIKDEDESAHITVLTMGPEQAKNALREVVAMGADAACLLSDRYFAGSDTAATARVLAGALTEKLGGTDLIICGQCAIDGDTAQTGPGLAQNLGIGLVTNVKEVECVASDYVIVRKETEDGIERIKANFPTVICMLKCDYEPRLPKIIGRIKAQDTEIPTYNAADIRVNIERTGIKGSPTYVQKAFRPEGRQAGNVVYNGTPDDYADMIIGTISEYLKEDNGQV